LRTAVIRLVIADSDTILPPTQLQVGRPC